MKSQPKGHGQPNVFSLESVRLELKNIADWWLNNTRDEVNGGFIGEVTATGEKQYDANKGIILNARILWFFSELSNYQPNFRYYSAAQEAFNYIVNRFNDEEHGGAVWELDCEGRILDGKKQTYAQCFCIYAFCAYFKLTGDLKAKQLALRYFSLVQAHCFDEVHGGYIEALTRDWQPVSDFRLSDKDLNLPKSMNTHLHVLEAFGALNNVLPSIQVEAALKHVLEVFEFKVLDSDNHHLKLFFENDWQDKSKTWSFGHDIEASWLLWEAAEFLNDLALLNRIRPKVIEMANVCLNEAIGDFGQVCDDYELASGKKSQHSEWWVQAEALVGFVNAFQLSDDKRFLEACQPIWQFICDYHLDTKHGEWHWFGETPGHTEQRYKVGFWKAPYHNGRAMMELSKRLVTNL